MSLKPQILMTTPYEFFRGQLEDIEPSIETCYHFNGLYRGEDNNPAKCDEVAYYRDVARLAGIVQERNAGVVVFGAWVHHVLHGSLCAAQFLIRHTCAESVLLISTDSRGAKEGYRSTSMIEVSIFELSKVGLRVVNIANVHGGSDDQFIRTIVTQAQEALKRITRMREAA